MKPQTLEIKTSIQIQKPVHEVFEAIVDPAKMSNYFIVYGSGRMETDTKLTWRFPELDVDVPVCVAKVMNDEYISYYWDNNKKEMLVEMKLTKHGNDTVVSVTEKSAENDEAGIKWLKGNTEGWANFLACLKAWLEYGVHLRKGAFDYRFEKK
ncbi:SRPBCC domain-containing protein [Flavobacterium cerinum]|uniref:ATPase n=1 Tax=Flavobacterium cerinum TaxID=2502784 RepID=A0A444GMN9_9FLAO|nr:SRPBCC domain-containing protein [Flavobacterium cerinum]RWW92001.1 ATPase [Flavobacterium cerinum]